MTYVDTMLTPAGGYTYVNNDQVYQVVAGAMTTHPAWDFVETATDYVTGGNIYRHHVWKCNAAVSGLPSDFFVVFEVRIVQASGLFAVGVPTYALLCEGYSAGTMSKIASNNQSITLAADRTNPATIVLSTKTLSSGLPTTTWYAGGGSGFFGNAGSVTSHRQLVMVANDALIMNNGQFTGGTTDPRALFYAGAYESIIGSTDDPTPLCIMHSYTNGSVPCGGSTRAPTFTPSTAYTDVFTIQPVYYVTTSTTGVLGPGLSTSMVPNLLTGTLGTGTNHSKNYGPIVSKIALTTCSSTPSTTGLFRGYLKHCVFANHANCSTGDTFVVDGKVYVTTASNGAGQGILFNTEAT